MADYVKVKNRDIARMFVKAMPLKDSEILDKTNEYVEAIRKLPVKARLALKLAYVFSSKVPYQEREDLFQELALHLYKAKVKNESLAYTIAKCDWVDWYRSYYKHSQFFAGSLDSLDIDNLLSNDSENEANHEFNGKDLKRLQDVLTTSIEFEAIEDKDKANQLWESLPLAIKPIVAKRLQGMRLLNNERRTLHYWLNTKGYGAIIRKLATA